MSVVNILTQYPLLKTTDTIVAVVAGLFLVGFATWIICAIRKHPRLKQRNPFLLGTSLVGSMLLLSFSGFSSFEDLKTPQPPDTIILRIIPQFIGIIFMIHGVLWNFFYFFSLQTIVGNIMFFSTK